MDASDIAVIILSVLLAISEALPETSGIKANSNFQAVKNGLKFLKDSMTAKKKTV